MINLIHAIEKIGRSEIEEVLKVVLHRYEELYPDWEVSLVSIQKSVDRNAQINNIINMLQRMKTHIR